jgi:hypothetical protein
VTPSQTKEFALVVRVVNCDGIGFGQKRREEKMEELGKCLESVAWETQIRVRVVVSKGWTLFWYGMSVTPTGRVGPKSDQVSRLSTIF